MSPEVKEILRCGIYQLLYMSSVPDTAAVNEAVELAKKMKQAKAGGFINAVLRSFLRDEKRMPKITGTLAERLSIKYSCPVPLVKLWLDCCGEQQTIKLLEGSLNRPPVYARVNTVKTNAEALIIRLAERQIAANIDKELADCIIIEKTGDIEQLDEFKEGLFHIQDKSSQLCIKALQPKSGERIIDVCAAPGGKSLTIAEYMQNKGELVSCDLHSHRAKLVKAAADRMGLDCIKVIVNDASQYNPSLGEFDKALCDVPCSGFGIIRRKPEIKYKPLEEMQNLPEIQYKILENTAKYLKAGGILLYSTCTINPAENEQVVMRFLNNHSEFEPHNLPPDFKAENGYFKQLLTDENTDGFFISLMRKKA